MTTAAIRPMQPEEFDTMRRTSVAAFDEPAIGTLLDALRASWAWADELCFVATLDEEIVGQVVYTQSILDAPDALVRVLVLSPVGIDPKLQGQGIGTQLITESLAAIAGRAEPAVFLEGNPQYYRRFGFEAGGDHGFRKPSLRIPDAAFQVRPLPGWTSDLSGTLVYNEAFWLTDSVGLR